MAIMTKENIEKAIRNYLNEHLDLIPQLKRDVIFDSKIKQVCMITPFSYEGQGEYKYAGSGEGWSATGDGGKSICHFEILHSTVMISEGDERPIVESIKGPILIQYLERL